MVLYNGDITKMTRVDIDLSWMVHQQLGDIAGEPSMLNISFQICLVEKHGHCTALLRGGENLPWDSEDLTS